MDWIQATYQLPEPTIVTLCLRPALRVAIVFGKFAFAFNGIYEGLFGAEGRACTSRA
jgi:hypothetical protein